MTTPIIFPEQSETVMPEYDWDRNGRYQRHPPQLRIVPPARPHISEPEPPAGWPDLRMTVADIAAGALLLVCMLIGAIGLVLATFWILSAFYDLVLRHIIEG